MPTPTLINAQIVHSLLDNTPSATESYFECLWLFEEKLVYIHVIFVLSTPQYLPVTS